ncbi:hypothetical protein ACFYPC_08885 [Streptomyces sp. NPDC005808]|uniref:hypothetical protein n=1 Tax=Streptomyces sp. NPDC005808 TaxID=3364734 RepID=UPI0036994EE8
MRTRVAIAACTTALAITLVACSSENSESAATAPSYKITKQDNSGNSRNVEVSVNSAHDLKAVFDDVTKNLTDEAGYHVYINCSTGGTAAVDNRLANGRLARGNMGQAATGLNDGETEFETVEGHTCP